MLIIMECVVTGVAGILFVQCRSAMMESMLHQDQWTILWLCHTSTQGFVSEPLRRQRRRTPLRGTRQGSALRTPVMMLTQAAAVRAVVLQSTSLQ